MDKDRTFISKYKPYYVKDFCIDSTLKEVLHNLIEMDCLNILFIGNSSSGKTALLNALIREYYNLQSTSSFPDNNILLINNLKEQGIQYFRNEMKTFCQSHSAIHGKKKLVIVDDIDNINEQSQQVFRNYIDKYKKNIHFIAVCSNIQKVIESIQSRMHMIQIPPATKEQIQSIMETIIEKEKLSIDQESKKYLLLVSNLSPRILINYLEKIYILNEPITIESCKKVCSTISFQHFEEFIKKLRQNQLTEAVHILYTIYDYGYSVIDILDFFFSFVKFTDMLDEGAKYKIIPYLCKYITIFHNLHEDVIELAFFTNNINKLINP
jgi:DNA polymerase III delta prime subunit